MDFPTLNSFCQVCGGLRDDDLSYGSIYHSLLYKRFRAYITGWMETGSRGDGDCPKNAQKCSSVCASHFISLNQTDHKPRRMPVCGTLHTKLQHAASCSQVVRTLLPLCSIVLQWGGHTTSVTRRCAPKEWTHYFL